VALRNNVNAFANDSIRTALESILNDLFNPRMKNTILQYYDYMHCILRPESSKLSMDIVSVVLESFFGDASKVIMRHLDERLSKTKQMSAVRTSIA
jgi:hypothetical protein